MNANADTHEAFPEDHYEGEIVYRQFGRNLERVVLQYSEPSRPGDFSGAAYLQILNAKNVLEIYQKRKSYYFNLDKVVYFIEREL